jgi:hypothetical protein
LEGTDLLTTEEVSFREFKHLGRDVSLQIRYPYSIRGESSAVGLSKTRITNHNIISEETIRCPVKLNPELQTTLEHHKVVRQCEWGSGGIRPHWVTHSILDTSTRYLWYVKVETDHDVSPSGDVFLGKAALEDLADDTNRKSISGSSQVHRVESWWRPTRYPFHKGPLVESHVSMDSPKDPIKKGMKRAKRGLTKEVKHSDLPSLSLLIGNTRDFPKPACLARQTSGRKNADIPSKDIHAQTKIRPSYHPKSLNEAVREGREVPKARSKSVPVGSRFGSEMVLRPPWGGRTTRSPLRLIS